MIAQISIVSFLIISRIVYAVPVLNNPTANFNLGIPLYTGYLESGKSYSDIQYGATTIPINITIATAGQQGKRDLTWFTFQHPAQPGGKVGEAIWQMSCSVIANKSFEGTAEFTFVDQPPSITAGVNASGPQGGTAGIQCPEGQCLSEICKGQELPVLDTFLESY